MSFPLCKGSGEAAKDSGKGGLWGRAAGGWGLLRLWPGQLGKPVGLANVRSKLCHRRVGGCKQTALEMDGRCLHPLNLSRRLAQAAFRPLEVIQDSGSSSSNSSLLVPSCPAALNPSAAVSPLSLQTVEKVFFFTQLATCSDHLPVGLQLLVSSEVEPEE